MKWTDSLDIAITLTETQPDTDPQWISFVDLHAAVCALKDFDDDPEASNERILEAIQMHWIEEND